MTGVLKVDDIQDAGANSIVSSNGSGTLTFGNFTAATITASTALVPDASDGAALGTTALEWSDLFLADGAIINFGDDQEVTLTHTADTGITLNSTNKLMFNDASQFIQGASATVLDIAATDEIELTATLIDVVGNLAGSGTGTFGGILKTDDATDATSTTDGSLQTDGGLSVAKDTIIGNDLKLLSDSAVLVFGAGSDATLTHTNDTGLTLNSTNKLMFNDASQFIQGSSATVLSIGATDEIDLTATAVDLNGTLDVSGTLTVAGNTSLNGGSFIFNEAGADLDFRIEADDTTHMFFVDASEDKIGINQSSPLATLQIRNGGADFGGDLAAVANGLCIENSGHAGMTIASGTSHTGTINFADSGDNDIGRLFYNHSDNSFNFFGNATNLLYMDSGNTIFNEDSNDINFRVESNGDTHALFVDAGNDIVMFGSSAFAYANEGVYIQNGVGGGGPTYINRNGGGPLELNRGTNDGTIVDLRQAGTAEGFISVDGSTVSFTTFMGAHWSQLADNSKPTILRGTVMESIADMSLWHTVKYNSNQGLVYADGDTIPEGKSIGDTLPVNYVYQEYDKPANENIGDTVTISHGAPAKNYTGVIEAETNLNLPKCKVSDTSESKAVYGVFHKWDDNDDGTNWQNDMSVSSLGTYMIRIHKDETVAIGDYIQSKGDGTGKKQADDIFRASTIGKVTSTEKVITHADGSYCVPCTLHCG